MIFFLKVIDMTRAFSLRVSGAIANARLMPILHHRARYGLKMAKNDPFCPFLGPKNPRKPKFDTKERSRRLARHRIHRRIRKARSLQKKLAKIIRGLSRSEKRTLFGAIPPLWASWGAHPSGWVPGPPFYGPQKCDRENP